MDLISDAELEKYITRIKESNKTGNKIINYKKAVTRLDELKTEYNDIIKTLKSNKKSKSKSNLSVDKIILKLEEINKELDNNNSDMMQLVENFIEYKNLLIEFESETDNIKNEINKVEKIRNKIVLEKIDINDLL
ncbi:hypothetical protein H012_gp158 [Acanthamoeba polyphaga moumouvirus]|uniref:Uncharacterized protein n=2 Tax=Moumouvirus TaxID=3080801 RepID=L7RD58_9VIRU|nr:hypothetical protein H012_gp158 [Acanthamoeba polyphaga moumouvirus]AEX62358.1 hypothetical protein mv_R153 [Moumouvirus Monve]AGC02292.1 hypothetical protein Moumou_00774 [Acanthamoeba polyphaga moumouvirus]AQN68634.1 hypothetical protein [Saudi moumouvirus]